MIIIIIIVIIIIIIINQWRWCELRKHKFEWRYDRRCGICNLAIAN